MKPSSAWVVGVAVLANLGFAGGVGAETAERRQDVTETVFFGSSTTDSGNLNILFFPLPAPPYVGGRASDGPVWAEYFAGSLGTGAEPSSLGGTNYALGGARTALVNLGFIPPITPTQIQSYLADAGGVADPRALYVIQAGANDLSTAARQPPDVAVQTVTEAVAATRTILEDLHAAGARRFLLVTVPELPTAPSVVLADGTNLAELMNDGFRAVALGFGGAGVRFGILDLNGLVEDVRANPAEFGLEVTECSFMGKSFIEIFFGSITPEPCDATVPPAGYMMFDNEHFTTAMHGIVADEAIACHRFLRGSELAPAMSAERCGQP